MYDWRSDVSCCGDANILIGPCSCSCSELGVEDATRLTAIAAPLPVVCCCSGLLRDVRCAHCTRPLHSHTTLTFAVHVALRSQSSTYWTITAQHGLIALHRAAGRQRSSVCPVLRSLRSSLHAPRHSQCTSTSSAWKLKGARDDRSNTHDMRATTWARHCRVNDVDRRRR